MNNMNNMNNSELIEEKQDLTLKLTIKKEETTGEKMLFLNDVPLSTLIDYTLKGGIYGGQTQATLTLIVDFLI